jgi:hypothetical protein
MRNVELGRAIWGSGRAELGMRKAEIGKDKR